MRVRWAVWLGAVIVLGWAFVMKNNANEACLEKLPVEVCKELL